MQITEVTQKGKAGLCLFIDCLTVGIYTAQLHWASLERLHTPKKQDFYFLFQNNTFCLFQNCSIIMRLYIMILPSFASKVCVYVLMKA